MPDHKPILVSIIGPTGVGKTALSIRLAGQWNTEIISCDSCQFYRFMDIGTAKITQDEQKGIPHHFLNFLNPDENYNSGAFEAGVNDLLKELFKHHEKAIMAGGSTLYAHALWNGIDEIPAVSPEIRESLNLQFKQEGLGILLEELKNSDPETYESIDRQNPVRIIRALEVYRMTGTPISLYRKKEKKDTFYHNLKIGLTMDREILYERINQRVNLMVEQGLIKEVESLLKMGYSPELPSMQAIGYKETVDYLQGNIPFSELIDKIQQHSRNYAKRQLTFFRRDKEIRWFDTFRQNTDEIVGEIEEMISMLK